MDILINIIMLVIGLGLGWLAAIRFSAAALEKFIEQSGMSQREVQRIAEELGVDFPIEEAEENSQFDRYVEVRVEEQDGVLYAYDDDTDQFLAQHANPEELVRLLMKVLPARTWVNIPEGKGDHYFADIKV